MRGVEPIPPGPGRNMPLSTLKKDDSAEKPITCTEEVKV